MLRPATTTNFTGGSRLSDALHMHAFAALNTSPGARAYYDELRTRKIGHHAALRQETRSPTREYLTGGSRLNQ